MEKELILKSRIYRKRTSYNHKLFFSTSQWGRTHWWEEKVSSLTKIDGLKAHGLIPPEKPIKGWKKPLSDKKKYSNH